MTPDHASDERDFPTDPTATRSPGDVEREISQTREELARTVDEIGRRLDPKVQAKEKASALRDGVSAHPGVVAGAGAAVVAGVAALMVIRRRRR